MGVINLIAVGRGDNLTFRKCMRHHRHLVMAQKNIFKKVQTFLEMFLRPE